MPAFPPIVPSQLFHILHVMPRGTRHDLTGILLGDGPYPVLRVTGGGEWRLDTDGRHRHMLGQRVRVIGKRCGFDMIDVERIERA